MATLKLNLNVSPDQMVVSIFDEQEGSRLGISSGLPVQSYDFSSTFKVKGEQDDMTGRRESIAVTCFPSQSAIQKLIDNESFNFSRLVIPGHADRKTSSVHELTHKRATLVKDMG
ncbi:hypothetical protein SADUNF_Sadunf03G0007800 [Salix dunnii]|uniref:Uncharacterized protein n=1 Tax=Salix dunnii TaxID=1413687 RepID=A0A835K6B6_9ROSI|nr:hypothetical protein SADUNF_Sadunf03G0007800 [Salix dunnii]